MDKSAEQRLLEIARSVVEAAVRGKPIPQFEENHPDLQGHQGAFVTIKNHGRLRGCIGQFTANEALYKVVRRMALASAMEDPRFMYDRVMPDELEEIDIEISVLSPLERTDDPLSIELGTHGIYIRRGGRGGCFLPQVATETGWTKEEFLSHCCSGKAGLPADAWKDPATEVLTFTAHIISEKEEA
ncbi:MAG: AmmeMemoRadiSam system protein A [Planctomycetota bacterium]